MEFITLALGLFVGIIYGWNLRERHAERVLNKFLEESTTKVAKDNYIPITIEKHNETFYVYNKETNTFMAQGSTRDELENILHDKFPGKKFACDEKTLTELGFL